MGVFGDPMKDVPMLSDVAVAEDATTVALMANPSEGGIFSNLFSGLLGTAEPETVVTEAGFVATETVEEDAPTGMLGGLLGFLTPNAAATPEAEILPQAPMVFGELRPACGTSRGELGTEIASVSGFTIYDTAPGTTTMRPHYITGFDDRCPRQFMAALVITGDVGTHEIVRYARTGVTLDYSQTDQAYEAIKASFCRVAHGEPCGARLERLGAKTTFVTAYQSFGAAPVWAEFLLYDGTVAAANLEGL